jgi:hypothetical protein
VLANPAIDDYQNASKDNRTMAQEENKSGAADPKNAGNG